MHGTTMVFLFVMPMAAAFANYLVPLQIGARDVAFPRLNAFGFWTFLFGGLFLYLSPFLGGAPDGGWFAYAPNTGPLFSPTHGMDFWAIALLITGIASLTSSINLIVTILNMRAPGMTLMKMPVFTWMILVVQFLLVFAMPGHHRGAGAAAVPAAVRGHLLRRHRGRRPAAVAAPVLDLRPPGGLHPHPAVVRHRVRGAARSSPASRCSATRSWSSRARPSASWAGACGPTTCSPRASGPISVTVFSLTTMFIAVPTGVKIINWIATMWGGRLRFTTAMLFAIGLVVRVHHRRRLGRHPRRRRRPTPSRPTPTTSSPTSTTCCSAARSSGSSPASTTGGRRSSAACSTRRLGKWNFWLMVVGMNLTFGPMHIVGLMGQPRRMYLYAGNMGFDFWNFVETIGAFILALGILVFLVNVAHHGPQASQRPARPVGRPQLRVDDDQPAQGPQLRRHPDGAHASTSSSTASTTEDDDGKLRQVRHRRGDPRRAGGATPTRTSTCRRRRTGRSCVAAGLPIIGIGLIFSLPGGRRRRSSSSCSARLRLGPRALRRARRAPTTAPRRRRTRS